MGKLELSYILIYKGQEVNLLGESRKVETLGEVSESRKTSLNGTIHQNFNYTHIKLNFSWSLINFDFCNKMQSLYNDYNNSEEKLYLKREKPTTGERETFEVVLSQPKIQLLEIISPKEKWGSLELEVSSKRCHNLSF